MRAQNLLPLALIGLLAAPPAYALTVNPIASDAALTARIADEDFTAEGRIGDLGGNATFEIDIGPSTAAPADTDNFGWVNTDEVPFDLRYDAGSGLATFTFNSSTTSSVQVQYLVPLADRDFDTLWIRAAAVNSESMVDLTLIELEGDALPSLQAVGANGLDIQEVLGGTLGDGFDLTGTAIMTWTGTPPTQSRLAFQFKVGNVVPEPGTAVLLGSALALLAARARRRSS